MENDVKILMLHRIDTALKRIDHVPYIVSKFRRMAVWSDIKEVLFLWCANPKCCVVLNALKRQLGYPASEAAMHPCTQSEQLLFIKQFMVVTPGTLLVDLNSLRNRTDLMILHDMVKLKHAVSRDPSICLCNNMLSTITENYSNTSFKIPLKSLTRKKFIPSVKRVYRYLVSFKIKTEPSGVDQAFPGEMTAAVTRSRSKLEANKQSQHQQEVHTTDERTFQTGGPVIGNVCDDEAACALVPLSLLHEMYPLCAGFLEDVVRIYLLGRCEQENLDSICQCSVEEGILLTRFLACHNGYEKHWTCLTTRSLMMSWAQFWTGYPKCSNSAKLIPQSDDVSVVTLTCQAGDVIPEEDTDTTTDFASSKPQSFITQTSPPLANINDMTECVCTPKDSMQNLGPYCMSFKSLSEDSADSDSSTCSYKQLESRPVEVDDNKQNDKSETNVSETLMGLSTVSEYQKTAENKKSRERQDAGIKNHSKTHGTDIELAKNRRRINTRTTKGNISVSKSAHNVVEETAQYLYKHQEDIYTSLRENGQVNDEGTPFKTYNNEDYTNNKSNERQIPRAAEKKARKNYCCISVGSSGSCAMIDKVGSGDISEALMLKINIKQTECVDKQKRVPKKVICAKDDKSCNRDVGVKNCVLSEQKSATTRDTREYLTVTPKRLETHSSSKVRPVKSKNKVKSLRSQNGEETSDYDTVTRPDLVHEKISFSDINTNSPVIQDSPAESSPQVLQYTNLGKLGSPCMSSFSQQEQVRNLQMEPNSANITGKLCSKMVTKRKNQTNYICPIMGNTDTIALKEISVDGKKFKAVPLEDANWSDFQSERINIWRQNRSSRIPESFPRRNSKSPGYHRDDDSTSPHLRCAKCFQIMSEQQNKVPLHCAEQFQRIPEQQNKVPLLCTECFQAVSEQQHTTNSETDSLEDVSNYGASSSTNADIYDEFARKPKVKALKPVSQFVTGPIITLQQQPIVQEFALKGRQESFSNLESSCPLCYREQLNQPEPGVSCSPYLHQSNKSPQVQFSKSPQMQFSKSAQMQFSKSPQMQFSKSPQNLLPSPRSSFKESNSSNQSMKFDRKMSLLDKINLFVDTNASGTQSGSIEAIEDLNTIASINTQPAKVVGRPQNFIESFDSHLKVHVCKSFVSPPLSLLQRSKVPRTAVRISSAGGNTAMSRRDSHLYSHLTRDDELHEVTAYEEKPQNTQFYTEPSFSVDIRPTPAAESCGSLNRYNVFLDKLARQKEELARENIEGSVDRERKVETTWYSKNKSEEETTLTSGKPANVNNGDISPSPSTSSNIFPKKVTSSSSPSGNTPTIKVKIKETANSILNKKPVTKDLTITKDNTIADKPLKEQNTKTVGKRNSPQGSKTSLGIIVTRRLRSNHNQNVGPNKCTSQSKSSKETDVYRRTGTSIAVRKDLDKRHIKSSCTDFNRYGTRKINNRPWTSSGCTPGYRRNQFPARTAKSTKRLSNAGEVEIDRNRLDEDDCKLNVMSDLQWSTIVNPPKISEKISRKLEATQNPVQNLIGKQAARAVVRKGKEKKKRTEVIEKAKENIHSDNDAEKQALLTQRTSTDLRFKKVYESSENYTDDVELDSDDSEYNDGMQPMCRQSELNSNMGSVEHYKKKWQKCYNGDVANTKDYEDCHINANDIEITGFNYEDSFGLMNAMDESIEQTTDWSEVPQSVLDIVMNDELLEMPLLSPVYGCEVEQKTVALQQEGDEDIGTTLSIQPNADAADGLTITLGQADGTEVVIQRDHPSFNAVLRFYQEQNLTNVIGMSDDMDQARSGGCIEDDEHAKEVLYTIHNGGKLIPSATDENKTVKELKENEDIYEDFEKRFLESELPTREFVIECFKDSEAQTCFDENNSETEKDNTNPFSHGEGNLFKIFSANFNLVAEKTSDKNQNIAKQVQYELLPNAIQDENYRERITRNYQTEEIIKEEIYSDTVPCNSDIVTEVKNEKDCVKTKIIQSTEDQSHVLETFTDETECGRQVCITSGTHETIKTSNKFDYDNDCTLLRGITSDFQEEETVSNFTQSPNSDDRADKKENKEARADNLKTIECFQNLENEMINGNVGDESNDSTRRRKKENKKNPLAETGYKPKVVSKNIELQTPLKHTTSKKGNPEKINERKEEIEEGKQENTMIIKNAIKEEQWKRNQKKLETKTEEKQHIVKTCSGDQFNSEPEHNSCIEDVLKNADPLIRSAAFGLRSFKKATADNTVNISPDTSENLDKTHRQDIVGKEEINSVDDEEEEEEEVEDDTDVDYEPEEDNIDNDDEDYNCIQEEGINKEVDDIYNDLAKINASIGKTESTQMKIKPRNKIKPQQTFKRQINKPMNMIEKLRNEFQKKYDIKNTSLLNQLNKKSTSLESNGEVKNPTLNTAIRNDIAVKNADLGTLKRDKSIDRVHKTNICDKIIGMNKSFDLKNVEGDKPKKIVHVTTKPETSINKTTADESESEDELPKFNVSNKYGDVKEKEETPVYKHTNACGEKENQEKIPLYVEEISKKCLGKEKRQELPTIKGTDTKPFVDKGYQELSSLKTTKKCIENQNALSSNESDEKDTQQDIMANKVITKKSEETENPEELLLPKSSKKAAKKTFIKKMKDVDEDDADCEKRRQREEAVAAEGFIKTQKMYYDILKKSSIDASKQKLPAKEETSTSICDVAQDVPAGIPVLGDRVISKAISDAERAMEGTGSLSDDDGDDPVVIDDLATRCRYQLIEDEDKINLGGIAYFGEYVLPFVYVNGYKFTPLKDALTMFQPRHCPSVCTIPRSILQKHKKLMKSFSTWEQVYKLELIKMKKGPPIKTGDMLLKLDCLINLLLDLVKQIIQKHHNTKLKRSQDCDIASYTVFTSMSQTGS